MHADKVIHRHWRLFGVRAAISKPGLQLIKVLCIFSRRSIYMSNSHVLEPCNLFSPAANLDTDSDSLSWIAAYFSFRFTWTLLSDIFPDHRSSHTFWHHRCISTQNIHREFKSFISWFIHFLRGCLLSFLAIPSHTSSNYAFSGGSQWLLIDQLGALTSRLIRTAVVCDPVDPYPLL